MLSIDQLKELIRYEPLTGRFYWKYKARVGIKPGDEAGRNGVWGYIRITIKGKEYRANRLAWLFTYGDIPPRMDVDHINGRRDDNRIANLRLASRSQNIMNAKTPTRNKTGVKGVKLRPDTNKYEVVVYMNGKPHKGGCYEKLEDATIAVRKLRNSLHGDFCRHD